jgi:hypothetical protein
MMAGIEVFKLKCTNFVSMRLSPPYVPKYLVPVLSRVNVNSVDHDMFPSLYGSSPVVRKIKSATPTGAL